MSKSANAVLARVRSMYGKRLRESDYSNLLSCSGNAEIANYLKNKTAYGDIFAPNTGTQITAESIEFSLQKELSVRLAKICSFEKLIGDEFYDYFILKSDIELIVSAARTLISASSLAFSYIPTVFFSERSALNIQKLYNAKTAAELIEALRHTRYYSTAKKFIGADGMFDFSMVEVHLYRFYAQCAKQMSKHFDKKSALELCEIIDLEIDAFNIANIYRLKKRGESDEIILAKLIFDHGTISKSKLLAMLRVKSEPELIPILLKTKLAKGFTSEDFIYPELVFEKNLFRIYKRYLRFSANPDIAVITYMKLTQTEIRNITHIVEGKRYQLPNEKIAGFLVGVNI